MIVIVTVLQLCNRFYLLLCNLINFRPTARLICKVYQEGKPSKICHMRIESMSQLLATTNIRSGSKVAVLETCSGVLLGMILERLGGKGIL